MTRKPIRICNAYENIGGNATVHEFEDTIQIMADDGNWLVGIRLTEHGVELTTALGCCKHNGEMLDSDLVVIPRGCGTVQVNRLPYREGE